MSDTKVEFVARWKGVLFHVCGVHEWVLGEGASNKCEHNELYFEDDKKPKLISNGKAHRKLRSVLWDEKFLNHIPYLLPFRSTAVIENFNDLILKYASKRIAYKNQAYRGRMHLAALDYSHHKDREVRRNAKGETIWKRKYNKSSKRWTAYQEKEAKTYPYIPELMKHIANAFDPKKQFAATYADPNLLSPTIAPVPPVATKVLAAERVSRFDKT